MKKEPEDRIQESGAVSQEPDTLAGLAIGAAVPPGKRAPSGEAAPSSSPHRITVTVNVPICADVEKLAPEWRDLVEKLLIEGLPVEDIAMIVQDRGGPHIAPYAVAAHYQCRLDLQARRAKRLVEKADELKRKLGEGDTADGRLANATLLTGLVGLTRRDALLTVKDANSLRLLRGNLQLRKRLLQIKLGEALRKKSIAHQHYLYEEERRQKLKLQNRQLEEIIKKLRQDQTLPADVMSKIQEIYGIVKEPFFPPELARSLPQE